MRAWGVVRPRCSTPSWFATHAGGCRTHEHLVLLCPVDESLLRHLKPVISSSPAVPFSPNRYYRKHRRTALLRKGWQSDALVLHLCWGTESRLYGPYTDSSLNNDPISVSLLGVLGAPSSVWIQPKNFKKESFPKGRPSTFQEDATQTW